MRPRTARDPALTTRDQILDAALQVVHSQGIARATTKEIAQAAHLSEAALYRHFSDKSDLLMCVIGERLPQLVATLKDLPNRVGKRSVRTNLEDVVRLAVLFYAETAPMAGSLFSEPAVLARYQAHLQAKGGGPDKVVDHLATYIRAEQSVGRIAAGVNPEAAAGLLIGACLGRAFLNRFVGHEPTSEADERFAKNVVRTLLHGLSPRSNSA